MSIFSVSMFNLITEFVKHGLALFAEPTNEGGAELLQE